MPQEIKQEVTILYRYREIQVDDIHDTRPSQAARSMQLYCDSFPVIKHTPCGVWIDRGYGFKKFVNLGAFRKWAHPTKDDAMQSFVKRKRRQVDILKHQLICAEAALCLRAENATDLRQGMFQLQNSKEDPYEPY